MDQDSKLEALFSFFLDNIEQNNIADDQVHPM